MSLVPCRLSGVEIRKVYDMNLQHGPFAFQCSFLFWLFFLGGGMLNANAGSTVLGGALHTAYTHHVGWAKQEAVSVTKRTRESYFVS